MEDISDSLLLCYCTCDWVLLMNNFAGFDEKLVKNICWLLDFQTIVNDKPSLNKGSTSLVKLDTLENLTEPVLVSEISREGAHNARFDTDILMKMFTQFMKC